MASDPCDFHIWNVKGHASNGTTRRIHLKNCARRNELHTFRDQNGSKGSREVLRSQSLSHRAFILHHRTYALGIVAPSSSGNTTFQQRSSNAMGNLSPSWHNHCTHVDQALHNRRSALTQVVQTLWGGVPSHQQTRRGPLPWQRIPATFLYEM